MDKREPIRWLHIWFPAQLVSWPVSLLSLWQIPRIKTTASILLIDRLLLPDSYMWLNNENNLTTWLYKGISWISRLLELEGKESTFRDILVNVWKNRVLPVLNRRYCKSGNMPNDSHQQTHKLVDYSLLLSVVKYEWQSDCVAFWLQSSTCCYPTCHVNRRNILKDRIDVQLHELLEDPPPLANK